MCPRRRHLRRSKYAPALGAISFTACPAECAGARGSGLQKAYSPPFAAAGVTSRWFLPLACRVNITFVNYAGARVTLPGRIGDSLYDAARRSKYEYLDGMFHSTAVDLRVSGLGCVIFFNARERSCVWVAHKLALLLTRSSDKRIISRVCVCVVVWCSGLWWRRFPSRAVAQGGTVVRAQVRRRCGLLLLPRHHPQVPL